jgi:hypothetical protein
MRLISSNGIFDVDRHVDANVGSLGVRMDYVEFWGGGLDDCIGRSSLKNRHGKLRVGLDSVSVCLCHWPW